MDWPWQLFKIYVLRHRSDINFINGYINFILFCYYSHLIYAISYILLTHPIGPNERTGPNGHKSYVVYSLVKGVPKKMWLAQNLKLQFPKNRRSKEAVLLTVCSTHEYYKQWEGQPLRTFGSWKIALLNFDQVTFFGTPFRCPELK